ncbi:hypothetical protein C8Q79DRAFT_909525 [Trametes meyenii]|nr:hypothetical protein C8Q79DRAFT_909525 [Trametes meyenii]
MSTSMSATHRCLYISEIFQEVVEELASQHERRALSQLSRTCKALNEVVVPALWRELDSLVPLLRLLPEDAWIEVPYVTGSSILQLKSPKRLDWTRFDRYAQHVRTLNWRERMDVSPLALSALPVYRQATGRPLLPKLRELIWRETRSAYFSFIYQLLTPTIRRLRIMACDHDLENDVMVALLDHASTVCTEVEVLEICSDDLGDDMPTCNTAVGHALAQFLRLQQNLTQFWGEVYLSAECVRTLAELPKLELLELYVQHEETHSLATAAAQLSSEQPWFSSLRTLSLNVHQLDHDTEVLLGAIQSQTLAELLILTHCHPDTDTVHQHLEAVARAPYRRTLTGIQMEYERQPWETDRPPVAIGTALKPLYALPQMEYAIINAYSLVVDAPAIRDIANAWPALEILALISYNPSHQLDGCLSLSDLVPLALKCPELLTLEVHLNAMAVPNQQTTERLLPGPSQSQMRCLTAFDAPINEPERVADFLKRMFPRLNEAEYRGAARFPYESQQLFEWRWKSVQDLLRGRPASV